MPDTFIGSLLRYIDEHIEEPLTLAHIARRAGYSPYHFSRMFSATMGMPAMEYVRMRKLEYAAVRLIAGDRVLDIALRYGFESQEGFTRAFKRVYGIPPGRYRTLYAKTDTTPPLHIPATQRGGIAMQHQIIALDNSPVIGYRMETTPGSADIPRFWQEIMADGRWERLMAKARPGGMNYGLCIHPADMTEGRMDYMIAFDYDGASPVDAGMELYTVPAAAYAVFTASTKDDQDMSPGIRAAWAAIYNEWFPTSGYTYDGDKPDFEAYFEGGRCDIYIPVIKA